MLRDYNQEQWKHYDIDSLTINTKTLAINLPLDNGHLAQDSLPPRSSPTTSALLSLPPEILHLILQHLPIQTLTQSRLLSTSIRHLISTNPLYIPIYTHVSSTLRAILATEVGTQITLLQLYFSLTDSSCSLCGSFGDFFNLLTGTRTCHACFATSLRHPYHVDAKETHLLPIPVSVAKSTYGLSPTTLLSLRTAKSIPGIYGRERSNFRLKRISLCLLSSAREAGIEQHGSLKAMNDFVLAQKQKLETKRKTKRTSRQSSQLGNGETIIASSIPDPKDLDYGWDNPLRHMVVVRFPWVRREVEEDVVEWGEPCQRCREKALSEEEEEERKWNVRFSEEGLREHLKDCQQWSSEEESRIRFSCSP